MLAQVRTPNCCCTVKLKRRHRLSVPLRPDWWGDDSDTAFVAWQKEAVVAQYAVHSVYRLVHMVRTAKEEEDREDDRNEEKEWEIRLTL